MEEKIKISFCTVAMNRLHHLRQTLPQNIADNIAYGNIEFVVLDYNSKDGLEDWIKTEMHDHINSGILKFYRTEDPVEFKRSHSRNLAFKLGNGDVLCNIDADNFTGENFAGYINNVFQKYDHIYVTPHYNSRDVIGKLAIFKNDFLNIRGYNEEMDGYGFEDIELYKRLDNNSRKPYQFSDKKFTKAIYHSNLERLTNEFIGINCRHVYIKYIDNNTSELYFLYKDGSFEHGVFVDKEDMPIDMQQRGQFDNMISLLKPLETGAWHQTDGAIYFSRQGMAKRKFLYAKNQLSLYNTASGERLYEICADEFKQEIMLLKTEVDNRIKLLAFLNKPLHQINTKGFGKGAVKANFEREIYID